MQNMQLVILMGGKASRLAPLSYSLPKGLLSIGNKPAIYNMIIDYVKRGLKDITIVVSPSNAAVVESFLNKTFSMINIRYVIQDNPKGPLHALQLCKDYITKPTLLLLGDTICETNLDYSYDWLGYMNISDHSHSRWCLIKTDSKEVVQELIDKPDYTPETNKVLIGLYNFADAELLRNALSRNYKTIRGELQLSSMIEYYCSKREMKGMLIKSWIDTGTLKDFNEAVRKNMSGRSYNKFVLDEYGILTKTSSYSKLQSEIKWLKKISNDDVLAPLIPKFYSSKVKGDEISYKIEYLNGISLAEYYLYYDIREDNWVYIFKNFLSVGKLMWGKKAPRTAPNIKELTKAMYWDKTFERIKQWARTDILEKEEINCNGEILYSFYKLSDKLEQRVKKLVETAPKFYTIIHGDPCFSNVLYFPETGTFKFLDPRGNFGVDTIYGDCRYDMAKARHCYHGLYDYITQGLYELKEISSDCFEYNLFTNNLLSPAVFDSIIERDGYDVDDIELIEGLLFISMIPLHKEDEKAQIMYYLAGLRCLNNQLRRDE